MREVVFSVLTLSALLAMVVGCAPATPAPTATPPPEAATLQFIGHSCTLLTAPDGTSILNDPYETSRPDGLTGFPADIMADAQTVSHLHPDHANMLLDVPEVIFIPGTYQVGMVRMQMADGLSIGYDIGREACQPIRPRGLVGITQNARPIRRGEQGARVPNKLKRYRFRQRRSRRLWRCGRTPNDHRKQSKQRQDRKDNLSHFTLLQEICELHGKDPSAMTATLPRK